MAVDRLRVMVPMIGLLVAGCRQNADPRQVTSHAGGDTSTAISADAADRRDQAMVRVVHAVPGASALDVFAGNQIAFAGVEFKDVTPYQGVVDNQPKFSLRPAGEPSAKPLAENAELVMDGTYYTVVAFPERDGAGVELEALQDDLAAANPAMARVRVVNVAARSPSVDIILDQGGPVPLFDDLDFEAQSTFKEVMPGKATLVVTGEGGRVLLRLADLELKPGQSLTLVLVHPSNGSSQLEAIRVVDELTRVAGR